ncbi:S24 family peptidase [Mucilaginibacter kameinonensis]|uniref:S24 family peptidase n=1 Tax=Mucilaginibacter kameinonensis TaxID=452286 RepID=UPI000EF7AB56|nr:S24/S26 family peptidase [Mucilaginibacter kameinonensis]
MPEKRLIDRFIEYLTAKNISFYRAEKDLAVGNGYIQKAITRNGQFGSDVIEKIGSVYLDINLIYLITGTGGSAILEYNQANTPYSMSAFNDQSAPFNTDTPTIIGKAIASKNENPVHPTVHPPAILHPKVITVDSKGNENILHVSIRSAAGYLAGHSDPEYLEKLPSFRLPGLTGKTYRSFEADGDSMDPTIKHQEMVIGEWVESLEDIKDDRVYIIVTKNSRPVIKRLLNRINSLGFIIAKSDATNNRQLYKNYTIDPDDILEVWYARFHGSFDFQAPSDMWKRVNNHEADITVLQDTVDKLMSVIKTAGLLNE